MPCEDSDCADVERYPTGIVARPGWASSCPLLSRATMLIRGATRAWKGKRAQ
jgi:hypothetical protein